MIINSPTDWEFDSWYQLDIRFAETVFVEDENQFSMILDSNGRPPKRRSDKITLGFDLSNRSERRGE